MAGVLITPALSQVGSAARSISANVASSRVDARSASCVRIVSHNRLSHL